MKLSRWCLVFSLLGVVSAFKTNSLDEEDDEEDPDEEEPWVPDDYSYVADLAVAFPVVITNISNFTGLLSGRYAPRDENITLHLGNQFDDLRVLYDKVSGFFTALHASMPGQDGPLFCPRNSFPHIRECIIIASCLIEDATPNHFEMSMYASYMEMLDRFVEQTWPVLQRQITIEQAEPHLHLATQVPDQYRCDAFSKPETYEASLLQVQEDLSSTLGMSAAMARATDVTHRLLDAHVANASMDAMVEQIQSVWKPICHKLGCDHENFWDIHFVSHLQTMALTDTDEAKTLRGEVRKRLRLERRVKNFMVEHVQRFASMLQSQTYSRAGRFFDYNQKSKSGVETWKRYGQKGKDAMMEFVMPYTTALAQVNHTRATLFFDQVEYRKFQEEEDRVERARWTRGDPQAAPVARALLVARESSIENHEDMLEEGGDLITEVDDEEVARGGKGFFKKVGKAVKKVAKTVVKAVETVGKFLLTLFACIGDLFEFVTTGYAKDIVPGNVAFGAGVTVGDMATGLVNLINGRSPVTWISIDMGFAVGVTAKAVWAGFGVGVGASCSAAGCAAYVSVGILGTVNLPMYAPTIFCPFGPMIGDPVTGFECSQVIGGSISAFCCNFNMLTGTNDCR